jgi:hypothetical protein
MPAATVSRARSTASFGSRPRRAGHCPRRMHSARRGHRQRGRSERGWEASRLLQASAANSSREIPRRQCPDGTTPLMPRFAEDDVRASARCSLLHVPPSWPSSRSGSRNRTRRVDFALFMVAGLERLGDCRDERKREREAKESAAKVVSFEPTSNGPSSHTPAVPRARRVSFPASGWTGCRTDWRYCLRRYYDLSVMPARSAA